VRTSFRRAPPLKKTRAILGAVVQRTVACRQCHGPSMCFNAAGNSTSKSRLVERPATAVPSPRPGPGPAPPARVPPFRHWTAAGPSGILGRIEIRSWRDRCGASLKEAGQHSCSGAGECGPGARSTGSCRSPMTSWAAGGRYVKWARPGRNLQATAVVSGPFAPHEVEWSQSQD
jgi:hypothetical protein